MAHGADGPATAEDLLLWGPRRRGLHACHPAKRRVSCVLRQMFCPLTTSFRVFRDIRSPSRSGSEALFSYFGFSISVLPPLRNGGCNVVRNNARQDMYPQYLCSLVWIYYAIVTEALGSGGDCSLASRKIGFHGRTFSGLQTR